MCTAGGAVYSFLNKADAFAILMSSLFIRPFKKKNKKNTGLCSNTVFNIMIAPCHFSAEGVGVSISVPLCSCISSGEGL